MRKGFYPYLWNTCLPLVGGGVEKGVHQDIFYLLVQVCVIVLRTGGDDLAAAYA